ncbi:MAG: hypothetical protein WDZ38_01385 [Balneolaceae bacterium]
MYIGLKHIHSYLAYLLLAIIIFSILYALYNLLRKNSFTEKVRKVSLAGMIAAHLQLLIGFILYFISPNGVTLISSEVMSDSISRLYVLEHPLTMIIAIVLITVGYIRAKKPGDDVRRLRTIFLYYTGGLILILLRIPWEEWI